MTVVLDSHKRIRSGEVSPTLAKRGRGVKVELVTHSNGELAA